MNPFHWLAYKYIYSQTQTYTHRSTYWNFHFCITVWSAFTEVCFYFSLSLTPASLLSSFPTKQEHTDSSEKHWNDDLSGYVYLRIRKNHLIWKSFPHSQFPKMGYTSWHLSTLCPLISSENNTFHTGYYEYWLRKHIWTYAVHSVDKETSLIFMTLYACRSRKNGHIQQ